MIKGDYDMLIDMAKNNVCAEHKTPVDVAWYGDEKCYVLRCGEGHYPDELERIKSLSEEHRAGQELPDHIKRNVEKAEAKRTKTREAQTGVQTFQGVPRMDLITGEVLDVEVVKALVAYAYRYSLDPRRGHVVMMYGKPYITMDGYLYHAHKAEVQYRLESRPLKGPERSEYDVPDGSHAWLATVTMAGGEGSFTGFGLVTEEEMTEKSKKDASKLRSPVVAKYPWQLAQKRAEWQALRRAFPIGEAEEVPSESGEQS